jgi:hypothetical protein
MRKQIYARQIANRYYLLAMFVVVVLVCIFYVMGLFFGIYSLLIAFGMILTMILTEGLRRVLYPLRLKHRTWGQGATGEEIVAEYLEEMLDSENLLINDVKISKDSGNIDHLVIGKHGIFVIETKTKNGAITCDGDTWTHEQFSKEGTRYSDDIGSPSKQAKANTKELNKFFKEKYPKLSGVWINAVVVFANKNTKLTIKNNPTHCSIMESPEELIKHIKEQQSKTQISGKDLYDLTKLFKDFSKNSVLIKTKFNSFLGKDDNLSKPFF